jgi:signal transduction histidine kinase
LVIFPSGPILSGITGAYGPQVADVLFVFWYLLIGFGTFAVLRMLVRRRLEVERLLAVIGRQERLAAIGGLASVIAHQTRHHLGILGMSSYVLGQKLADEPLSPAARAAVAHELDAMARTRAELDHLLTAGMHADGSAVEFHALALMRECGAHLGPLAEGRGVAITYAGSDVAIRGDRVHLKQAVTNLIRNAIEAAPPGSSVTVGLTAGATDVRLTVRDGGSGLSPRARMHLFEPLFTEKSGGLGMGLYVTRAIVEAHGGSLTLASTGDGTEAEIRLARSASRRGL